MLTFKQLNENVDRLKVHQLQKGHVMHGTGETVVSVSAGARTPKGKMDVTLEKDGRRKTSQWGRHTTVGVRKST